MRTPKNRPPTHPGEILLRDFLEPMGISQTELAQAIHVLYQRINELVNGKRGVTPSTALRLSKFFGNSCQFWLNLQQNWDLYHVLKEEEDDPK
jgi:addiction module HigA family antidote